MDPWRISPNPIRGPTWLRTAHQPCAADENSGHNANGVSTSQSWGWENVLRCMNSSSSFIPVLDGEWALKLTQLNLQEVPDRWCSSSHIQPGCWSRPYCNATGCDCFKPDGLSTKTIVVHHILGNFIANPTPTIFHHRCRRGTISISQLLVVLLP